MDEKLTKRTYVIDSARNQLVFLRTQISLASRLKSKASELLSSIIPGNTRLTPLFLAGASIRGVVFPKFKPATLSVK